MRLNQLHESTRTIDVTIYSDDGGDVLTDANLDEVTALLATIGTVTRKVMRAGDTEMQFTVSTSKTSDEVEMTVGGAFMGNTVLPPGYSVVATERGVNEVKSFDDWFDSFRISPANESWKFLGTHDNSSSRLLIRKGADTFVIINLGANAPGGQFVAQAWIGNRGPVGDYVKSRAEAIDWCKKKNLPIPNDSDFDKIDLH